MTDEKYIYRELKNRTFTNELRIGTVYQCYEKPAFDSLIKMGELLKTIEQNENVEGLSLEEDLFEVFKMLKDRNIIE